MKNLFTLFICVFSLGLHAQYAPLLDSGHIWQIERTYGDPAEIPPPDKWHQQIILDGDTVLDGKTYQLLWGQTYYHEYFQAGMVLTDSAVLDPYLYAIMREDSASQQVYIWRINDATIEGEDLWMDFSLSVDDTLFSEYYKQNVAYPIVTAVDSLLLANGETRKTITVSLDGNETRFVEGVCSEAGFREPVAFPTVSGAFWSESILCQQKNGVETYGSCTAISTSISQFSSSSLSVFPNPTTGRVSCTIDEAIEGYQVLDMQGRMLLSEIKPNIHEGLEIDLTALPTGTYALRIDRAGRKPLLTLIQKL